MTARWLATRRRRSAWRLLARNCTCKWRACLCLTNKVINKVIDRASSSGMFTRFAALNSLASVAIRLA